MNALDTSAAYRLWAPTYAAETAISALDEELAAALSPPVEGCRLLDAGCGVGRRMGRAKSGLAIGVDASPEMLAAGGATHVAAADVRALPFADESFDLIWCRLVLGHITDPAPAYHELARVCRRGGHLLISDFHPDATAAGHTRSFRDASGLKHEVEHHVHGIGGHIALAERSGFALRTRRDGVVGPSIESYYRQAGRLAAYRRDRGLAVVAAFVFQRT